MIHLYSGDGKGKTTAAVGLAVRALGHGRRVVFAQFLKGGSSGEIVELERLGAEVLRTPPHGFWWTLDSLEKARVMSEHDGLLRELVSRCRSSTPPELLVLDEFTYVNRTPMADGALCEELITEVRRRGIETVITGRDPGLLVGLADYFTEMKANLHPFDRGIPAREGIEW